MRLDENNPPREQPQHPARGPVGELVLGGIVCTVVAVAAGGLAWLTNGPVAAGIGGGLVLAAGLGITGIRARGASRARQQAADPESMRPDAEYDVDYGRLPRSGDAFQGTLGSLSDANADRNASAKVAHDFTIARMQALRRKRALCERLRTRRIPIETGEIDALARQRIPHDCTVGELYDLVLSRLNMNCNNCKYYLRGLPANGHCPECGAPYRTGMVEWEQLCGIIAEGSDIDPDRIATSTSLVQLLSLYVEVLAPPVDPVENTESQEAEDPVTNDEKETGPSPSADPA